MQGSKWLRCVSQLTEGEWRGWLSLIKLLGVQWCEEAWKYLYQHSAHVTNVWTKRYVSQRDIQVNRSHQSTDERWHKRLLSTSVDVCFLEKRLAIRHLRIKENSSRYLSIMTWRSRIRVSIASREKKFLLLHSVQSNSGVSYAMGTGGFFSWGEAPRTWNCFCFVLNCVCVCVCACYLHFRTRLYSVKFI